MVIKSVIEVLVEIGLEWVGWGKMGELRWLYGIVMEMMDEQGVMMKW